MDLDGTCILAFEIAFTNGWFRCYWLPFNTRSNPYSSDFRWTLDKHFPNIFHSWLSGCLKCCQKYFGRNYWNFPRPRVRLSGDHDDLQNRGLAMSRVFCQSLQLLPRTGLSPLLSFVFGTSLWSVWQEADSVRCCLSRPARMWGCC